MVLADADDAVRSTGVERFIAIAQHATLAVEWTDSDFGRRQEAGRRTAEHQQERRASTRMNPKKSNGGQKTQ